MFRNRSLQYGLCTVALVTLVGCSATRGGKCKSCDANSVYPAPTYYDSYPQGTTSPYPSPAPMPAAEPLPLPSSGDPNVPPPPEALRARPIDQISASSRGLYYSARDGMRALFTRD